MSKPRKKFVVYRSMTLDNTIWYWRLKSGNSQIIADGAEGYATVATALRAVKQINDLLREPLPVEVQQ